MGRKNKVWADWFKNLGIDLLKDTIGHVENTDEIQNQEEKGFFQWFQKYKGWAIAGAVAVISLIGLGIYGIFRGNKGKRF